MATKTAIAGGSEPPKALEGALGKWGELTRFLSDVRAEMRKVVAPGRKEVQVTTSVVVITVFIFGIFFFVVDYIFRLGVDGLLNKLGGMQ